MVCYRTIGSGKSRSMKNFGGDEIFLVNVIGKALPFRGTFRDTCTTDSSGTIIAGLRRMPCRTAVIDDAGYLVFCTGRTTGRIISRMLTGNPEDRLKGVYLDEWFRVD